MSFCATAWGREGGTRLTVVTAVVLTLVLSTFGSGVLATLRQRGALGETPMLRGLIGLAKASSRGLIDEVHPDSRPVECGSRWQNDYIQLHSAIRQGLAPDRWLLVEGVNGIADNLRGAVSMLFVAVITRRALMLSFGHGQHWEWAFEQPNINWTWDAAFEDPSSSMTFKLGGGGSSKRPEYSLLQSGNVRELGEGFQTIRARSFAGMIFQLLNNQNHKEEFYQLGLHPQIAFSCGLQFLFRVKPEILTPFVEEMKVMTDASTLKIGIQIRTGDKILMHKYSNTSVPPEWYNAFLDCAEQLKGSILSQHKTPPPVKYYFISDSMELRRHMADTYGDQLVTSVDITLRHVVKDPHVGALMKENFVTAVAEIFMFSLADYHIFSAASGFGKAASAWSGRWNVQYGVVYDHRRQKLPAEFRKCTVGDADLVRYA